MKYYISKINEIVYSNKTAKAKYKQFILLQMEFQNDISGRIKMTKEQEEFIDYQIQSNIDFYEKLSNANVKHTKVRKIMEILREISR